jgi:hypothetical protein
MNYDHLFSNINEHAQLSESEKEHLLSVLIPRPFKQGEIIVQSGDPTKFFIVNSFSKLLLL